MQNIYINQSLRISYLALNKYQNRQVKPIVIQSAGKHTKAKSLLQKYMCVYIYIQPKQNQQIIYNLSGLIYTHVHICIYVHSNN